MWSEKWGAYGFDLAGGDTGFGIGAHTGYNVEFDGGWVLGAEGDFTFVGGDGEWSGALEGFAIKPYRGKPYKKGYTRIRSSDRRFDEFFEIPEPYANVEAKIDWLASLRMRAGHSFGDIMPFVTAGGGWASYSVTGNSGLRLKHRSGGADYTIEQLAGAKDGVAFGPVVGGGLDYRILPNVVLRGEALYYMFSEDIDTSSWVKERTERRDPSGRQLS